MNDEITSFSALNAAMAPTRSRGHGRKTTGHAPWKEPLKDVLGGTFGGLGLVLAGHPFDTVKVRLVTQPREAPIYNGMRDCFVKTWKGEGMGGLYKGVVSPLFGQMFLNATQFFAWGRACAVVKSLTGRGPKQMTASDFLLCGVFTGVACGVVESPIDFYKSQLQVQVFRKEPLYRSVPEAVRKIVGQHGIFASFQGMSATLIRNIPFRTFYFAAYESTVAAYAKYWAKEPYETLHRDKIPLPIMMLGGGLGGLGQWFICYPLDCIKTTMQTDNPGARRYRTWTSTVRIMYKEGGYRSFVRGFVPCMVRSFPANAVCFTFYEKSRSLLGRMLDDDEEDEFLPPPE